MWWWEWFNKNLVEVQAINIFLLIMTLAVYAGAMWLFRKSGNVLLHPLISSTVLIILGLKLIAVDYEQFRSATEVIHFMLGPSVVALGWAMYRQLEHLRANMVSILTSLVIGSVVGILSVVGVMRLMGASAAIEASIVPKSVTTPIAVEIAERSGGIPSLTAVVVILVGILGSVIAPPILRRCGVVDAIARGLALGSAAHGIGTARAMELGAIEGALSGLAMALVGLITAVLVPLFGLIL